MSQPPQSIYPQRLPQLATVRLRHGVSCLKMLAVPVCIFLSMIDVATIHAAERESAGNAATTWYTGSAFRRELQRPASIMWDDAPLRDSLQTLGRAQRMAIFLDRRVDPGQTITFRCQDVPLEQALRELTRPLQLGVGFVGPVIYIGPPLTSARIATLAERRNEQIRSLPTAAQHRLLERTPLGWPDLAEPRLLFAGTASQVGLTVPNIQSIPHDLWYAAELPPMTFAEKATLLSAGFDMSFRYHHDATKVSLTRSPRSVAIDRDYRVANPQQLADLIEARFPQAFVSVDSERSSVKVRTSLEDHWQINDLRSGKRIASNQPKVADSEQKRYTLTIDHKPVEPVLQVLAKQLARRLEISDDVAAESRQALISVSVKDATDAEMLRAIAKSANLSIRITAESILVTSQPIRTEREN